MTGQHADDAQERRQDAEEQRVVAEALAAAPPEPVPADVLSGLLATVRAEIERRAEGEATRERAAAISATLQRSARGTYGVNVPRRPTVPHAVPDVHDHDTAGTG
ncbi:hypothetical protein [Auraticoccus monumenti]|uniref:Uncharacterized protein n=1 Tax=Auraticoccus monumenti TaxID=675864 RepID=A0A1G6U0X3_9ACTN|nr:hypothetical protein [Auraticoccus monumenti]SDD34963.1 hypothetical protein SAMN04489747_0763 [Auraticoccus monumenti]